MPNDHTEVIQEWLTDNDLYEENLFFYTLIIIFWFFVGFVCLGFELEGFSLQQNLFFNFVFYLFICAMMALCPFWFKLFFGNYHNNRRQEWFDDAFSKLDDEDRQLVTDYLQATGHFVKQPLQRWSLIFLGSYFLFEIFFISAWVKDLALVWEPRWATAVIEWAISHTNTPPLNVDRDLFMLDVLDDEIRELGYTDDYVFMNSELGHAVMLYHTIKTLMLGFVMTALIAVLWKPMSDFGKADPMNIDSFSTFLYSSFVSFWLFLFFLGSLLAFVSDVELVVHYIFGKFIWLALFWQHMCLIFILFYFKFVVGWCVFWRRVWEYLA